MRDFDSTNTLKDEFKFNIISTFQTGNVLIDTFIRVFLFTLITSITSYFMNMGDSFHSIKKIFTFSNIHNFFYKPKVITITGSRYLSFQYLSTKLNFSLRFKAVLDKIIKSMIERNENNKLVQKIKELEVRENISYYYDDERGKRDTAAECQFIVDQEKYIQIEDNIFCKVVISNSLIEQEKKTSINKEEYTIELYSYSLLCKDLFKYVENLTDDYEKKQKELNNTKKYVFKFDGKNKESERYQWKVNELDTTRNLSHVFFEEKDNVIKQIDNFVKERKLYEKIGKPYQLGILLEGEPGCGKTSFLIGLANHLKRSIKDCQFNKMKTVEDLEKCVGCLSYDNKDMSMDNVVMVAEDFDCMSDIAKSRKLIEKEEKEKKEERSMKKKEMEKHISTMKTDEAKAMMCAVSNMNDEPTSGYNILTDKPKNLTDSNEITLASLLNIMDGILSLPGRIFAFTSNCPEEFDEAFLRPGRIDIRIKFKRCNKKILYEIMEHWYKTIDEYYNTKNNMNDFKKYWKKYENKLDEYKWRPCDVANLIQQNENNIENVFKSLVL